MQNLQLLQHLHDDPDGHSSSLIQPVGAVASRRYAASGVASGANIGTSTPSRRNDMDIESSRFLFMPPPLLKFVLMRPSALSWINVDCTTIFSLRTRSVTLAGCADDTAKTETRQTNDLSILLSWRVWYAVSRRRFEGASRLRINDIMEVLGPVSSKVVRIGDTIYFYERNRTSSSPPFQKTVKASELCPSFS